MYPIYNCIGDEIFKIVLVVTLITLSLAGCGLYLYHRQTQPDHRLEVISQRLDADESQLKPLASQLDQIKAQQVRMTAELSDLLIQIGKLQQQVNVNYSNSPQPLIADK